LELLERWIYVGVYEVAHRSQVFEGRVIAFEQFLDMSGEEAMCFP
jgi:hypothetical protein